MNYPGRKRRFRVEIRVTEVHASGGEDLKSVSTWRVGGKDVAPAQVAALANVNLPDGMEIIPIGEERKERTSTCPQVSRLCEDGKHRDFDCCDTGMRSGGQAHDMNCEVVHREQLAAADEFLKKRTASAVPQRNRS